MATTKTKPVVEPVKPHVPMYLGEKAYVFEGKMYYTPLDGGPTLVHPDHVDVIQAKMDEQDAAAGIDSQVSATDPLATASRDELLRELIRLRAKAGEQTEEEPLDIVADLGGTSGAPAATTPPVPNPFTPSS